MTNFTRTLMFATCLMNTDLAYAADYAYDDRTDNLHVVARKSSQLQEIQDTPPVNKRANKLPPSFTNPFDRIFYELNRAFGGSAHDKDPFLRIFYHLNRLFGLEEESDFPSPAPAQKSRRTEKNKNQENEQRRQQEEQERGLAAAATISKREQREKKRLQEEEKYHLEMQDARNMLTAEKERSRLLQECLDNEMNARAVAEKATLEAREALSAARMSHAAEKANFIETAKAERERLQGEALELQSPLKKINASNAPVNFAKTDLDGLPHEDIFSPFLFAQQVPPAPLAPYQQEVEPEYTLVLSQPVAIAQSADAFQLPVRNSSAFEGSDAKEASLEEKQRARITTLEKSESFYSRVWVEAFEEKQTLQKDNAALTIQNAFCKHTLEKLKGKLRQSQEDKFFSDQSTSVVLRGLEKEERKSAALTIQNGFRRHQLQSKLEAQREESTQRSRRLLDFFASRMDEKRAVEEHNRELFESNIDLTVRLAKIEVDRLFSSGQLKPTVPSASPYSVVGIPQLSDGRLAAPIPPLPSSEDQHVFAESIATTAIPRTEVSAELSDSEPESESESAFVDVPTPPHSPLTRSAEWVQVLAPSSAPSTTIKAEGPVSTTAETPALNLPAEAFSDSENLSPTYSPLATSEEWVQVSPPFSSSAMTTTAASASAAAAISSDGEISRRATQAYENLIEVKLRLANARKMDPLYAAEIQRLEAASSRWFSYKSTKEQAQIQLNAARDTYEQIKIYVTAASLEEQEMLGAATASTGDLPPLWKMATAFESIKERLLSGGLFKAPSEAPGTASAASTATDSASSLPQLSELSLPTVSAPVSSEAIASKDKLEDLAPKHLSREERAREAHESFLDIDIRLKDAEAYLLLCRSDVKKTNTNPHLEKVNKTITTMCLEKVEEIIANLRLEKAYAHGFAKIYATDLPQNWNIIEQRKAIQARLEKDKKLFEIPGKSITSEGDAIAVLQEVASYVSPSLFSGESAASASERALSSAPSATEQSLISASATASTVMQAAPIPSLSLSASANADPATRASAASSSAPVQAVEKPKPGLAWKAFNMVTFGAANAFFG